MPDAGHCLLLTNKEAGTKAQKACCHEDDALQGSTATTRLFAHDGLLLSGSETPSLVYILLDMPATTRRWPLHYVYALRHAAPICAMMVFAKRLLARTQHSRGMNIGMLQALS